MSKIPLISINGSTDWSDAVTKLRTGDIDALSNTWVQDEDTKAESLSVTENGTHAAASAGKYGYDYVTVSVKGERATGKDPTTGNDVIVTKNPETGKLVKEVIPSRIAITTMPTKMTYTDGETMDYTGIVVHAYNSDGIDMGAVPFNELVFPVSEVELMDSEWTDGNGINAKMIFYTQQWARRENIRTGIITEHSIYCCAEPLGTYEGRPATYCNTASAEIGAATLLVTRYNGYNYAAAITGDVPIKCDLASYFRDEMADSSMKYTGWKHTGGSSATITEINKFIITSWEKYLTDLPISTRKPVQANINELHGAKKIPVQWARPGDAKQLETEFEINVTTVSA